MSKVVNWMENQHATAVQNRALDMPTKSGARTDAGLRIVRQRIEQRIADLGTSARAVSIKAGLGETAVHDILSGKNQQPSVSTIKAIAKALSCNLSFLVGETNSPELRPEYGEAAEIPLIGIAETGAFRRMVDFDQGGARPPKVLALKNRQFPAAKHFALKIRGDSMNAAQPYPLLDGMVVLCVDFTDAGLEIETGRIYAVRRTLDDGQTYECTIKRAKVFRDRYELHPESANPSHKPLTIPRGAGSDEKHAVIEVIGLVYGLVFEGDL